MSGALEQMNSNKENPAFFTYFFPVHNEKIRSIMNDCDTDHIFFTPFLQSVIYFQ
jgi:hypothetical protein